MILQRFPDARALERDTLLGLVRLVPGMRLLDIQAAGGYLSEAAWLRLDGHVTCVCVEPSGEHRSRLDPRFVAVAEPIERFPAVTDGTIDAALGLAGLHHSTSHRATLAESLRVLRPGGELALCDVLVGSAQARWLNEFVDAHSPSGHDGRFPIAGATARVMRELGFVDVVEDVREVPWRFASRADALAFMVGIFGLSCGVELVDAVVDDYLELRVGAGGVEVTWPLMYCRGVKPVSN